MRNVRIALGQMRAVQGDTRANMKKMEAMAAGAAAGGADIICFPELSYIGYFVKKDRLLEIAEREDGEFVRGICEAAKKNGICIVAGFAERGDSMISIIPRFLRTGREKLPEKQERYIFGKVKKRDLSRERNFLFLRRNLAGRPF